MDCIRELGKFFTEATPNMGATEATPSYPSGLDEVIDRLFQAHIGTAVEFELRALLGHHDPRDLTKAIEAEQQLRAEKQLSMLAILAEWEHQPGLAPQERQLRHDICHEWRTDPDLLLRTVIEFDDGVTELLPCLHLFYRLGMLRVGPAVTHIPNAAQLTFLTHLSMGGAHIPTGIAELPDLQTLFIEEGSNVDSDSMPTLMECARRGIVLVGVDAAEVDNARLADCMSKVDTWAAEPTNSLWMSQKRHQAAQRWKDMILQRDLHNSAWLSFIEEAARVLVSPSEDQRAPSFDPSNVRYLDQLRSIPAEAFPYIANLKLSEAQAKAVGSWIMYNSNQAVPITTLTLDDSFSALPEWLSRCKQLKLIKLSNLDALQDYTSVRMAKEFMARGHEIQVPGLSRRAIVQRIYRCELNLWCAAAKNAAEAEARQFFAQEAHKVSVALEERAEIVPFDLGRAPNLDPIACIPETFAPWMRCVQLGRDQSAAFGRWTQPTLGGQQSQVSINVRSLILDDSIQQLPQWITNCRQLREMHLPHSRVVEDSLVFPRILDYMRAFISASGIIRAPDRSDTAALILQHGLEQWVQQNAVPRALIPAYQSFAKEVQRVAAAIDAGDTKASFDLRRMEGLEHIDRMPAFAGRYIQNLELGSSQVKYLARWAQEPAMARLRQNYPLNVLLDASVQTLPHCLSAYRPEMISWEHASISQHMLDTLSRLYGLKDIELRGPGSAAVAHNLELFRLLDRTNRGPTMCTFLGVDLDVIAANPQLLEDFWTLRNSRHPMLALVVCAHAKSLADWQRWSQLLIAPELKTQVEKLSLELRAATRSERSAKIKDWYQQHLPASDPALETTSRFLNELFDCHDPNAHATLLEWAAEHLQDSTSSTALRLPAVYTDFKQECFIALNQARLYLELRRLAPEIRQLLSAPAPAFHPEALLDMLTKVSLFHKLYHKSSSPPTVTERTLQTLRIFEEEHPKYSRALSLAQKSIKARDDLLLQGSGLDVIPMLRLLLVVQELGRSLAAETSAHDLTVYALPLAKTLLHSLGASEGELHIFTELLSHDMVKELTSNLSQGLRYAWDARALQAHFMDAGKNSGMPVQDFALLLYLCFISAAGSLPKMRRLMEYAANGRLCFPHSFGGPEASAQLLQALERPELDLQLLSHTFLEHLQAHKNSWPTLAELLDTDSAFWQSWLWLSDVRSNNMDVPDCFEMALAIRAISFSLRQTMPAALARELLDIAEDICVMVADSYRTPYVQAMTRWRSLIRELPAYQPLKDKRPELEQANIYMDDLLDGVIELLDREILPLGRHGWEQFYDGYFLTDSSKTPAFRTLAARTQTRPLTDYVWLHHREGFDKLAGSQIAAKFLEDMLSGFNLSEKQAMHAFAALHAFTMEVLSCTTWPAALNPQQHKQPKEITVVRTETSLLMRQVYDVSPMTPPQVMAAIPHTALDCGSYQKVAVYLGEEITVYRMPIHRIIGGDYLNRHKVSLHSVFGHRCFNELTFVPTDAPCLYAGTLLNKPIAASPEICETLASLQAPIQGQYYIATAGPGDPALDPYYEERARLQEILGMILVYRYEGEVRCMWHPCFYDRSHQVFQ